jgi:hypothetical protein
MVEGGGVEFGCVSNCVFLRHNRKVYDSGRYSYFLSGPQVPTLTLRETSHLKSLTLCCHYVEILQHAMHVIHDASFDSGDYESAQP